jgi:hypothetical protein
VPNRLEEIFEDQNIVNKIQTKLPYLFRLAELESSRAGKIGMEVGSLREKILIALLIYKFGEENVDYKLPITEPEVDVKLFGAPISIKTITGQGGVKAVWTVDATSAKDFIEKYTPKADIILVQINWQSKGQVCLIPIEAQKTILKDLGCNKYFKLPKAGTNPRGVEFSKEAISKLQKESCVKRIEIEWKRPETNLSLYDVYRRWVDYWSE